MYKYYVKNNNDKVKSLALIRIDEVTEEVEYLSWDVSNLTPEWIKKNGRLISLEEAQSIYSNCK